ncbi:MAG: HlyD family efflux transporter periplasmic adaptor subunit [Candidatus Pedobacter colombiensis]|uniref:HlyD family efflux transporter periplasmic adaptor subunit n=1 Tax=Candidatus Pedobacter colombiensis TaxID=3121371 RepID=A0AAJ5W7X8_9SPHI|nr:HlyD family efflux transporter periplasmic adaptor subunit [Pedobacter sp.]WEK20228.1 MAG: HlyD family efflux transporter periplasmic adaptor subunit [Pedobacter sp.]
MEIEIENIKETDKRINGLEVNSEEVQEIITAVPSWILRRGITLIFGILLAIVLASAFIRYPDVVKTSLKVNSLNAPKSVMVKQTGKIVALLVKEGTIVKQYQPLAFMESTASHRDVLKLHEILMNVNSRLISSKVAPGLLVKGMNLGELQGAYQNFYQQYLQYVSAQNGGYYLNRKKFLEQDLKEIQKLKVQIIEQQKIQEKEFSNIEHEFEAYKKLYQKNMVSTSEYKQQENKYLAGKYPLQQSLTALLNNNSSYAAKQKEILELDHTIQDEQAKFVQSLSNMINETDTWINLYILRAPVDGRLSYAGIVQENQTVNAGQEIFMINPDNTDFFGEVHIPQYNMGKVKTGQRTLIKMRSFPFEQYGLIRGKVNYISDVAFKDSVFIAKISFEHFENKDPEHRIMLKNGMQGDAEIVTEESSLLQRFMRNVTKMLNSN